MAKLKCPFCVEKFDSKSDLYTHINETHIELLPEGFTPARYMFMKRNKGKVIGHCVICKNETQWNEKTERYLTYCSNECKIKAGEIAKANMKKTYGKEHLLDDAQYQRDIMMKGRSLSGVYTWSDGTKFDYFGEYEKDLLVFEDIFLNLDSKSIAMPSNKIVNYEYEDKIHSYIPDQYIPELNLLIEVKYGDDNTHHYTKREAPKNEAKWKHIKDNTNYNFIILRDKEYSPLLEILSDLKKSNYRKRIVMDGSNVILSSNLHKEDMVLNENVEILDYLLSERSLQHPTTNSISSVAPFYPVYLVMTAYDNIKGKLIRGVTNSKYNHASISFNKDLSYLLSFKNMGKNSNIILEDLNNKEYRESISEIGIFAVLLSKNQYHDMLDFAKSLFNRRHELSYRHSRYIELLFKIKNREVDRNEYVCSEFVDALFKSSGVDISGKANDRVTPQDLISNVNKLEKIIKISDTYNKGDEFDKILVSDGIPIIKTPKEIFNGVDILTESILPTFDMDNLRYYLLIIKLNNGTKTIGLSIGNKFINGFICRNNQLFKFNPYDINDVTDIESIAVYECLTSTDKLQIINDSCHNLTDNNFVFFSKMDALLTILRSADINLVKKRNYDNDVFALISYISHKYKFTWTNTDKVFHNELLNDNYLRQNDISNMIPVKGSVYDTLGTRELVSADDLLSETKVNYIERGDEVNYYGIKSALIDIKRVQYPLPITHKDIVYFQKYYNNMQVDKMNVLITCEDEGDDTHRFLEIHRTVYEGSPIIMDWYNISLLVKDETNELFLLTIFDKGRNCPIKTIPIERMKQPFFDKENSLTIDCLSECNNILQSLLSTTDDINILSENFVELLSDTPLITIDKPDLKDTDFAIPSRRKYPIYDFQHIQFAINHFDEYDDCDKRELAVAIYNKLNELNYGCNKCSSWYDYLSSLPEYKELLSETVNSSYQESLELSLLQEKEIPIDIDNNGSLIIKKSINNNFGDRYQQSHKLLKIYHESNNIDGIKKELLKLWYMNNIIENYIIHPKNDPMSKLIYNIKKPNVEQMSNVRSHILNDFKKYLKVVLLTDKDFDFQSYYNHSKFNEDEYRLDSSNIKALQLIINTIMNTII